MAVERFYVDPRTGVREMMPGNGLEIVEENRFIICPKHCHVGVRVHELHMTGFHHGTVKVVWIKDDFSIGFWPKAPMREERIDNPFVHADYLNHTVREIAIAKSHGCPLDTSARRAALRRVEERFRDYWTKVNEPTLSWLDDTNYLRPSDDKLEVDRQELVNMMEQYMHGLQRHLLVKGAVVTVVPDESWCDEPIIHTEKKDGGEKTEMP